MSDAEAITIRVRPEQGGDAAAIRALTDAAFGQPDEARIVDAIRAAGHPAISLVALDGAEIVGHILFTPVTFDPPREGVTMMGLAPMAVTPGRQRRGVGSMLVRDGLRRCAAAGIAAVVVVGHPGFYPRFGFVPGRTMGLRCEYPVPDDVFMAVELVPGALRGYAGLVRYVAELRP
jgi:putative acetyltransferase